jgi:uncharacterized protein YecE (DUF72 family)
MLIGTSGWAYEAWKEDFYAHVPRKQWLSYYATRFPAVEVNATFYHSLKSSTFEHWREATPDKFRFCLKANRWMTHVQHLAAPDDSILRERERATALRHKLAVVLWQLPTRLGLDLDLLAGFVGQLALWPETRHAVEFRNEAWFLRDVEQLLTAHGIAVVQSDAADWPMWGAVTTDFVYVRLHGHEVTYHCAYSQRQLLQWANKAQRWASEGREIYLFFDNTDAGWAPRNAETLQSLLAADSPRQRSHVR